MKYLPNFDRREIGSWTSIARGIFLVTRRYEVFITSGRGITCLLGPFFYQENCVVSRVALESWLSRDFKASSKKENDSEAEATTTG